MRQTGVPLQGCLTVISLKDLHREIQSRTFKKSSLTNTLYTHYHLDIPNDNCKPKISGNYKLTVYDDDHPGQPVLIACFMLTEPFGQTMGLKLNVTARTDATINDKHQQVDMIINYGTTLYLIRNNR